MNPSSYINKIYNFSNPETFTCESFAKVLSEALSVNIPYEQIEPTQEYFLEKLVSESGTISNSNSQHLSQICQHNLLSPPNTDDLEEFLGKKPKPMEQWVTSYLQYFH